jgi:tetratricopeptide (TPR) repeat protein
MGTCSEKNGKTSLLYLLARRIVNPLGHIALVVSLGALGAGAYWSARLAWADYLFRMDTESSVRRAVRLEPANAEYHARLARLLENTNDVAAESELGQAIAGNPRLSSAWIELGLRAENAGDASRAEEHLVRAAEVDRMYTAQWTLANFYFRHNQGDKFWPVARRALRVGDVGAYDPAPLFRLCWKLSRDPSTILDRAIPDVGRVEARYLEFLVRENRVPAAEQVSERVVAFGGDYELGPVFEYCDRLIFASDAGRAISRLEHSVPARAARLSAACTGGGGFAHQRRFRSGAGRARVRLAHASGGGYRGRTGRRATTDSNHARWPRAREVRSVGTDTGGCARPQIPAAVPLSDRWNRRAVGPALASLRCGAPGGDGI